MEEEASPDSQWASHQPLQAARGITAVAGEVRTLSSQPLEGVTLQIDDRAVRTDDTGRFLLTSISPGHHELLIDGRTASQRGRAYGLFEVGIDVRAGRTNVLPFTIWMPEIDTANAVSIPSPTPDEVVVTTPNIPGLELHLPPGTIIRDKDGQVVTQISITPIPVDRPPFPLPFGAEFPMYFTVQPGGAYIEPYGARIIYPNITNELPGTRINFWNYDPEEKDWHIYGRGTVTRDRKQVVPDEGVVIYEFAGASFRPFKRKRRGRETDGDPVDLATGLFVFEKTDLFLPDVLPVALTRTHRHGFALEGVRPFGIGSAHPYELFLSYDIQFQEVDLTLPDGGRVHYTRTSPGTGSTNAVFEHTATPSVFFKSRLNKANNSWELTLKDGTTYTFSDTVVPLLLSIKDRFGNSISIARGRDEHGKVTRVISPNGRWLEFTLDLHDIRGNVTHVRDNTGRIVAYDYDEHGGNARLTKVTDPMGGITEYKYDSSDRIRKIKDARGIVFLTNDYDDDGRVKKQTQLDGSTYKFDYTVDSTGEIIQTDVTDPRDNVRRVTFNADGYTLTDTRALGTPEEQTTTYEREESTNLVLSITDPLGRKTANTYDAMGNVRFITRLADTPEAVTTEFTYEPEFNQLASVTDPLGHTIALDYDKKGNLITITDALHNTITIAPNSQGQPVSITDALGHVVQLTYDLGIRNGMTDPLGATTTRYIDSAGQPITFTDPLGLSTTYTYDPHNRLTKVTDSLSGVTAFSYDPNGNLLSLTDARGSVTGFTPDEMDRLSIRRDPLGRSETHKYDAAGNLKQFTDRKGQVTSFSYDVLNRLKQVTHADDSTTTFTYDAGNRVKHVMDSISGAVSLDYDNMDRPTEETTPQGKVTYTYDTAGRRKSMTVQGQPSVIYDYDDVNRLTEITQGATSVAIGYDAAGRSATLTLPGEVVVEFSYDAASQLKRITYRRDEDLLGDLAYEYDPAGNRINTDGSFARTALPEAIASLTYDAANRLTTGFTYDDNGNLTSDGVRTYVWDGRNRLASISGPGITASFGYDPFGRRISKTINGTTTEFLYDGLNIVQEISAGTPIANLLTGLGIDEYFIRTDVNGSQILLFDALGSTLGLLDRSGLLQTEYTYEPFGATTATGAASPNPFQYTGRENDATGLYCCRARYYSPTLERFISEDPGGFAGGDINLYAYALSNPTNFTDPLGLSVDALTVADCSHTIWEAWERQKQTSERKDEVEGVKDAIEELNRTIWEMIKCLSPIPLIFGAATGGGKGGGEPPNPYRDPSRFIETPLAEEERRAAEEYAERWHRRFLWRRRWW